MGDLFVLLFWVVVVMYAIYFGVNVLWACLVAAVDGGNKAAAILLAAVFFSITAIVIAVILRYRPFGNYCETGLPQLTGR